MFCDVARKTDDNHTTPRGIHRIKKCQHSVLTTVKKLFNIVAVFRFAAGRHNLRWNDIIVPATTINQMNVNSYLWLEAVCHQSSEDWIALSYLK